jgi:hypothetical protein
MIKDTSVFIAEFFGSFLFFALALHYNNPLVVGLSLTLGLIVAQYINISSHSNYLNPVMIIANIRGHKLSFSDVIIYGVVELFALFFAYVVNKKYL